MIKRLKSKIDARDMHFYIGVVMLATGFGFIYPPAALITAGAVFLYVAIMGVK